jgi:serine/threonine-protein kinase
VVSLFEANDPRGERSDTVTARTLLTRGERQAVRLAGEPVAQAELLDVIGRIRMMLGAYADARPSLEHAYAITRQLRGDGHPASIRRQLGLALLAEREGRLDDADRDNRAALEHAIRIGSDSSVLALDALFQLASVQHLRGRYASSDSIFLRWSAGVERAARPADSTLARQLHVYGEYLGARQQLQRTPGEAVAVLRRALAARRSVFGAGHTDVAVTQQRLAIALSREGQMAEADSLMADALPILERAYPEGHRELVDAHHNYGAMLQSAGRHREALRHFETAAAMMTRLVGADHPLGAAYHLGWGSALLVAGEHAEAVRILAEAGDRFRGQGATGALMASVADLGRSESLLAIGRRRDAERLALDTYRSVAAAHGDRHRLARRAMRALVATYEADARTDAAARWRVRLAAADSAAAAR